MRSSLVTTTTDPPKYIKTKSNCDINNMGHAVRSQWYSDRWRRRIFNMYARAHICTSAKSAHWHANEIMYTNCDDCAKQTNQRTDVNKQLSTLSIPLHLDLWLVVVVACNRALQMGDLVCFRLNTIYTFQWRTSVRKLVPAGNYVTDAGNMRLF